MTTTVVGTAVAQYTQNFSDMVHRWGTPLPLGVKLKKLMLKIAWARNQCAFAS
jgi:hypothetical protein